MGFRNLGFLFILLATVAFFSRPCVPAPGSNRRRESVAGICRAGVALVVVLRGRKRTDSV